MSALEKFENSFISDPNIALIDYEEVLIQNQKLYLRINLMDKHFINSYYFKEISMFDERIKNKAFRFNLYNVFCIMFKEETICKFFDISKDASISGLFKGMIFLLDNSLKKKYYPIKCTILEFIMHELLTHNYAQDLKKGWCIIRSKVMPMFDENDFGEFFKCKDRTYVDDYNKIVLH